MPTTDSLRSLWIDILAHLRASAPDLGVEADQVVPGQLGEMPPRAPYVQVYVFPAARHQRAAGGYGQHGRDFHLEIHCGAEAQEGRDVTEGRSMEAICDAAELAERVCSCLATAASEGAIRHPLYFDESEPLALVAADAITATVAVVGSLYWTPSRTP